MSSQNGEINSIVPPRATYRVQLNAGFTFSDARRIVPYLARLGMSTLYTSPIFRACPGSSHGYDVTDYNVLNPELGTEDDFRALVAELQRHEMGLIVDFVPNHMGIGGGANAWWLDVLENGQTSAYADYFDIDWRPLKPELRNKVLLPLLGDHYGMVLERGELDLRYADGSFTVWYYDHPLPIAPPTYPAILKQPLEELTVAHAADDPALLEYQSIITAFDRLAPNNEHDPDLIAERQREQLVAKRRLDQLLQAEPAFARAGAVAVERFNGTVGDPATFDELDRLLDEQSYRLAFWRTAADEINYRRFFAINDLAAIRQEEPAVFDATHALLLRLIDDGSIGGVRIDHLDGLWDPAGYVARLRERALAPIYLVVEKILEPGEVLPGNWQTDGTVGYEFARLTTGLFVDPAGRKAFDTLYKRFTGRNERYDDLAYELKKLIMRLALASEVNVLARVLNRVSEQRRTTRDFTLNSLRFTLREIIACFPVYRTYVTCDEESLHGHDRRSIETAVARAKRRNPASDLATFDFVRDVLLLRYAPDLSDRQRTDQCHFWMRFQQLTGPVTAKGVEDTAFYVYNRLTSLNEVGGDPTRFGLSLAEFHRENAERLRQWPRAMLTSSTHDTKRSEDVRARISALSEMPREWRASINRWTRLTRRLKTKVDGELAPDRNDEYLFYQTLLGAWPFGMDEPDEEFVERIVAYMLKAIHEAQVHTSWINPNQAYDDATEAFVRAALGRPRGGAFLDEIVGLRREVARVGAINSLAQQLLKLAAPGEPDLYQGTELWDFSLVDPDNRRPVDFELRRQALTSLRRRKPSRRLAAELCAQYEDGRVKLYVTNSALELRRRLPDVFREGGYEPIAVEGKRADHIVAFARRHETGEVIVAVPRLVKKLVGGEAAMPIGSAIWDDTRLVLPEAIAGGAYQDIFCGEEVEIGRAATLSVGTLFGVLPVALLARP